MSTSQLLKRGYVSACSLSLPICWDVVSAKWIILWTWYDMGSCTPRALVISNSELLHVACRSKMFQDALPRFDCFPFFGHLPNIGTSHHIFFPQLWLFRHQASAFPSLRNDPLWFVRASATAAAATATMVGTTTWEKDLKGVHLWNIHRHLQIL